MSTKTFTLKDQQSDCLKHRPLGALFDSVEFSSTFALVVVFSVACGFYGSMQLSQCPSRRMQITFCRTKSFESWTLDDTAILVCILQLVTIVRFVTDKNWGDQIKIWSSWCQACICCQYLLIFRLMRIRIINNRELSPREIHAFSTSSYAKLVGMISVVILLERKPWTGEHLRCDIFVPKNRQPSIIPF